METFLSARSIDYTALAAMEINCNMSDMLTHRGPATHLAVLVDMRMIDSTVFAALFLHVLLNVLIPVWLCLSVRASGIRAAHLLQPRHREGLGSNMKWHPLGHQERQCDRTGAAFRWCFHMFLDSRMR
jgi:hypothetical protein